VWAWGFLEMGGGKRLRGIISRKRGVYIYDSNLFRGLGMFSRALRKTAQAIFYVPFSGLKVSYSIK